MELPHAIFFDVNETLLDMQAIKEGLACVLDGDTSLVDLWFNNLLHHSLVDVVTSQFHDFIDIGAASLSMVAHSKGIHLSSQNAKATIKKHITALPAHKDVHSTLKALSNAGLMLVALSNSSQAGLSAQLEFAGIVNFFNHVLSVESIRTYKPHPDVYQWACQQANVRNEAAMMVAAHGWDVSGAKATGMQTIFVQRPGKMMYPLGLQPDHTITSLHSLPSLLSVKL